MTWEGLNPPYSTIVADPPWHYDSFATMPGNANKKGHTTKREPSPYATMTVAEIKVLPVSDLAGRDAFLFLWTTNLYLPESFGVASAWGFTYRQMLIWHKTGNPSPFGGAVAPNHAEFLLVAAKGSPKATDRLAGSVIPAAKPYQHSRKPALFLDCVERVAPGPYIELFSRDPRMGWDSWGKGYESSVA
jgi:N6-adenosine-specific RNA methylase IME4